MWIIEVIVPLKKDIQKLDHLLQIKFLIFVEFERLNRQLYSDCQFAAIATEDDLGVFIYNSSFCDALIVAHHAVHLNCYLVEVKSLSKVDMSQRIP